MNILFMGVGHMAGSLIKGIKTNSNDYKIFVNNRSEKTLIKAQQYGVQPLIDLNNLNKSTIDFIVLGVRPVGLDDVVATLDNLNLKGITIVSMLSGVSIDKIKSKFIKNENLNIVRIMPNMNANISMSVTGLCSNNIDPIKTKEVIKIFKNCGTVELINEELFSQFTISGGCTPAFQIYFINEFIKAAVKSGLDPITAKNTILASFEGTIQSMKVSNKEPQELINEICVPNGITIEGVKVLDNKNFGKIIDEAFNAALNKDKNH